MNDKILDVFLKDIFNGPLTFLLQLIYKREIHISDITIKDITQSFSNKIHEFSKSTLNSSAEFIGITSLLLWMKSKILLPQEEKLGRDELPDLNTLYQLVEYCYFKNISNILLKKYQQQSLLYPRGIFSEKQRKKFFGVEQLSLEDLSLYFQKVMQKNKEQKVENVYEEEFRVSDQIQAIKAHLLLEKKILFSEFFNYQKPKAELIANFLALLEILKLGIVTLINNNNMMVIIQKKN